ncbi:hypothetical protein WSM22_17370 [Cytophagales bacterium WSM2-2]|nr:hypothetical protein WSM22_17370 [Cytophagales bacterium WSM2-2]
MNKKLIIFGTGDIGQIANFYFKIDSDYEPVAFTINRDYIKESTFEGLPVVPFEEIENKYSPEEFEIFIALSYSQMNKLRTAKYEEAKSKGYKIATYISSKCIYLSQYKAGENCFIFENNVVQPFVKIGNNVTIWSGNHIGHHSVIEDNNFISSHVVISGHCHVEPFCFLGVNSTLAHKVRITSETLLGAGAIITKDTEFAGVYVPAKTVRIEKKSSQFEL